MENRKIFLSYLEEKFPNRIAELTEKFDIYFNWLSDINQKINLISRKTPIEDYWTLHFLDVLQLLEVKRFTNEMILDFGTGGGLPGIPMAILFPEAKIYLLDARKKKLLVLDELCDLLDLDNVELVHGRIEEVYLHFANSIDVIISRSVRITKELKKPLMEMLKHHSGEAYFYKSQQLDDMDQFKKKKIFDVSRDELGTRKIIKVNK